MRVTPDDEVYRVNTVWLGPRGLPVAHDRAFRAKARDVGIDPRAVLKHPVNG